MSTPANHLNDIEILGAPAPPAPNLVCPVCRREGASFGQHCPEHHHFYVPTEALEDAPQGHPLGRIVGNRWAILGLLGRGGMGTVYWGIEHPSGRRAAIKVLRSDLTAGSAAEQRFLREAQAVASMDHPNLIRCFDYGIEPDKLAYMALEYLEGTTLDHFIHDYRPDLGEIVHAAVQTLEGIKQFHAVNIVHRDLKPGNVMLCREGEDLGHIKIIDFGLARLTEGQMANTLTLQGDVFGTPLYMSPEQCVGTHDVGPASDVYAFGVMLYEMLTGRTPFTGNKPMGIMMKHMGHEVPPLRPRRGIQCPPALVEFVYNCLAKDTADRYKDGGETLEAFLALRLHDPGPIRYPKDSVGLGNPTRLLSLAPAELAHQPPAEGSITLSMPGRLPAAPGAAPRESEIVRRLVLIAKDAWRKPVYRLALFGALGVTLLLTATITIFSVMDSRAQAEKSIPVRNIARNLVSHAHQRATVGSAQFGAEDAVDEMVLKQRKMRRKRGRPLKDRRRDRAAELPR